MIRRLAISLFAVFLFVGVQLASSQVPKPFDPKSYPPDAFHISHHDYPIGKFTVRIIQVKALDDATATNPSLCRAWLEVRDGGKILRQAYFDDIDAIGWIYGIFLPEHQPLPDYFLAWKEGDYDGRLLLVGKDGSLTNLPGGDSFLTPDKRYLIGSHDSDYQYPFVVDLARRRLVVDGEKEKLPGVDEWYMDKAGYFFVALGDDGMPQGYDADSKPATLVMYRLDLKSLTVKKGTIAAARLKLARKVNSVQWPKSDDCTSAP
ncbi:MAG: hypothetical protein ABR865_02020 [Terracidiphilus sp.]|jgi:hypothetical protein